MHGPTKWSDDSFLDRIRSHSDTVADEVIEKMRRRDEVGRHGHRTFRDVFGMMADNDDPVPGSAPPEMKEFFRAGRRLPAWADIERLNRGQEVFEKNALPASLCLLAYSLPSGYAAPNLSRVLSLSGDLRTRPYTRLLGVLQVVVEVGAVHGFESGDEQGHCGEAVTVAQKLRLMHSAIRVVAEGKLGSDFKERYGIAINLEDMLATIMGFSLLVIEGLERIHVHLTDQEKEDYYHVWQTFAVLCGIHPEGEPSSSEFVPTTVAEAREFYASYQRRWFVYDRRQNPEGVPLARANLAMIRSLMPRWARWLGLGIVPRIYMQRLMGEKLCRAIGIRPIHGLFVLRWILIRVPDLLMRVLGKLNGAHHRWASMFLQGLINHEYGGSVRFFLPQNLQEIRELAPPLYEGEPGAIEADEAAPSSRRA